MSVDLSGTSVQNGRDWGELPNSTLTNPNDEYTFTLWVLPRLASCDSNFWLISSQSATFPNPGAGVLCDRATGAVGYLEPAIGPAFSGTQALNDGVWNFVALRVVIDAVAGSVEVSVNGGAWEDITVAADTTGLVPTAENRAQNIGRAHYQDFFGFGYFDGQLEDVRYYTRLLSQAEIDFIRAARGKDNIVNWSVRYPLGENPPRNTPSSTVVDRQTTSSASGTAFAVGVPTRAQSEDGLMMVVVIAVTGAGAVPPVIPAPPAGWTLRNAGQTNLPATGSTPAVYIYTRDGGSSSEPATYNFNTDISATKIAHMIAVQNTGVAPDTVSAINTGTSAAPVSPSVAPSADAFVLRVCCTDGQQVPTDYSDFYPDAINGRAVLEFGGVGNGVSLGISDLMMPSGATGTVTWNPAAADQWGCLSLAFLAGAGLEHGPRDDGLDQRDGFSMSLPVCEEIHF